MLYGGNTGTILEDLNRDYFHCVVMSAQLLALTFLTDGASNIVRTPRSLSWLVLIAAMTIFAESESPPKSKNEDLDPDPLEPEDVGVDAGQDLLGGGGRGAVPIGVGVFRCRSALVLSEFTVDRERQRLEYHDRSRRDTAR